ncbi:uncharacterized protein CIMG_04337 [Coccidioides immitis RS]|uniref:Uncharacterized protein n=1 Tax=Coccidioides immitis (strain RS) TaxID=246410 RepID=A0A0E1RY30_COCIM|nr:uncharacterized protein CIMG_04337 [Coccidioides immitis RS]EAS33313.1 hypothetical protein CIMG_04337 [Coccidioides immitis RS]
MSVHEIAKGLRVRKGATERSNSIPIPVLEVARPLPSPSAQAGQSSEKELSGPASPASRSTHHWQNRGTSLGAGS